MATMLARPHPCGGLRRLPAQAPRRAEGRARGGWERSGGSVPLLPGVTERRRPSQREAAALHGGWGLAQGAFSVRCVCQFRHSCASSSGTLQRPPPAFHPVGGLWYPLGTQFPQRGEAAHAHLDRNLGWRQNIQKRWLIRRMVDGHRLQIALDCETERQALAQLALFEQDPHSYKTPSQRDAEARRQAQETADNARLEAEARRRQDEHEAAYLNAASVARFLEHIKDRTAKYKKDTRYYLWPGPTRSRGETCARWRPARCCGSSRSGTPPSRSGARPSRRSARSWSRPRPSTTTSRRSASTRLSVGSTGTRESGWQSPSRLRTTGPCWG